LPEELKSDQQYSDVTSKVKPDENSQKFICDSQLIKIGSKVSKEFGDEGFFPGVVRSFPDGDSPFYKIVYEDGDAEDMDEDELRAVLIYDKNLKED